MNLPGMAFPAFIPKISNYADIALVYKWYKIGNVSPAYSNSYSSPGTYSVGDVIIMFVESVNEVNTINSVGYIKIADILGNGTTLSMYYHIVDGSDNGFFWGTTTNHFSYYFMVYSGVDIINPINTFATSKQDTSTTLLSAPAVTSSRKKCCVINTTGCRFGNYMGNGASAWTNSYLSAFAELCDLQGNVSAIVIASGVLPTAGDSGITTFTYSTSTPAVSITLALNPKEL